MALMPAQPVLGGALPCQLCQQYHPPNETCFQHASHHRQSQARHHHHRSRSRARHVSDSDSDRASRRSRRKSGRSQSSHRKRRRSSGRRRRSRKVSSSDSTESSVLSDSSSDSDFTPSAMQLLGMGERMSEDVGSSQPAPPVVPVGVPVPAVVETPAPRDFYQDIRRAYSRGGVLGQQPAEREGRPVRSLDPTQEELDAVRESRYARSQLLNTPSMHPLGADESHFSWTPYLPVRGSPSLPPKARLSAAHPSTVSSPSMWDNDPLLGPGDLLPVPTAPPSVGRSQHGRPSPIRAPSSVHPNSHMGEEQIQAAMQHKSVSEAAFPLSGRGGGSIAVARPARAAAPSSAFMVRTLCRTVKHLNADFPDGAVWPKRACLPATSG